MRNALIQGEQVPRREIHHPPGQVKPDMAVKRVHRDSACRRVLMHARIRFHSNQHNAKIRVLYKRLRTSPGGGQPRFILVQLVELAGHVKLERSSDQSIDSCPTERGCDSFLCGCAMVVHLCFHLD